MTDLARRLVRRSEGEGWFAEGDRVLVAFSGGLDSSVLLHLLRFTPELPEVEVHAAHFDHRMRPGSEEDMLRCRGTARAWSVPFHGGEAASPPSNESEARDLRYDFLLERRVALKARWLVTAHHADDQAETVLFRMLRGTGPRGLAGIPATRAPSVLRPLLPFWRKELEAYASRAKLRPVEDPTNHILHPARNMLRREILPRVEERVAPGARKALVRLASLQGEREVAAEFLVRHWLESVGFEMTEDGAGEVSISLPRGRLVELPREVLAEVVRYLLRQLGSVPSHSGTGTIVEFINRGSSGRSLRLPGGITLAREFDFILLKRSGLDPTPAEDRHLEIGGDQGEGTFVVAGRAMRARWSRRREPVGEGWPASIRASGLAGPLRLRGWAPGDRIRLSHGSKKLKKLFVERRIPLSERARTPVLADGRGRILWVPGVAIDPEAEAVAGVDPLFLKVGEDHGA